MWWHWQTFLLNLTLAKIRSLKSVALAVASSGIAATLLDGGKTAHSAFKIPLDLSKSGYPSCSINRGTAKAAVIKNAKIIVWDEVTMTHKKAMEAVDRMFRDIMERDVVFGGKLVVLCGDFRQTLPVVRNGNRAETVSACLKT